VTAEYEKYHANTVTFTAAGNPEDISDITVHA